ncbi:MAG: phosphoribosylformylglycinamidine synthase subunit PurS [Bdellovibrio sp.]|nr:phosphoribosylformylglycinamidine synthase subunit PurS [Bdellovibrio sp.]
MMTVGIKIMPRDVILDSQGRAIEESMKNNGFKFEGLRAGKFLEVSFSNENKEDVKTEIEKMLKIGGLYNPLIEKFEIIF